VVDLDPRPAHGTLFACNCFPWPEEVRMSISMANIPAVLALIIGILILIVPRFLNYLVAIYLILVGLLGLGILR
jgi:hypothetical protein